MSELFENLTVEHFINEVKRHPEIWNPASEDYHDRDKKKSSWISISRRFCDEFDQKNDSEKNEICELYLHIIQCVPKSLHQPRNFFMCNFSQKLLPNKSCCSH